MNLKYFAIFILFTQITIAPLRTDEQLNKSIFLKGVEFHYIHYIGNISETQVGINRYPIIDELEDFPSLALNPNEEKFCQLIEELKKDSSLNVKEIISPLTGRKAIEITTKEKNYYSTIYDGVILWEKISSQDEWISYDKYYEFEFHHGREFPGIDIIRNFLNIKFIRHEIIPQSYKNRKSFGITTVNNIRINFKGHNCEGSYCVDLLRERVYGISEMLFSPPIEVIPIEEDIIINNGDGAIFAVSPNYFTLRLLSSCLDKRSRLEDIGDTMEYINNQINSYQNSVPYFPQSYGELISPISIMNDINTLNNLSKESHKYKEWMFNASNYLDRFEETRLNLMIYNPKPKGHNSFPLYNYEGSKIFEMLNNSMGNIPEDSTIKIKNKIDLFETELLRSQYFIDARLITLSVGLTIFLIILTIVLVILTYCIIRRDSQIKKDISRSYLRFREN